MNTDAVSLLALYLGVLVVLSYPLGIYMSRIFSGKNVGAARLFAPLERAIYKVAGIDPTEETGWRSYAVSLMLFNIAGFVFLFLLQRAQGLLPFNPEHMGAVAPDLAFNTAISFVTNTNWQAYGGESTMGYLVQMLGLTVQNFVSAATGIAVAVALIRGFARHSSKAIGNFWVDVVRATLHVLLPLAIAFGLVFVSEGMIQNLSPYKQATTLETVSYQQPKVDANGGAVTKDGKPVMETVTTNKQTLAMGPVASQEAIKLLGTNGGGFFNANSAHPFENPTPFTNFLQVLAIFLVPAGLVFAFGAMVGDKRQGIALFSVMTILFVAMVWLGTWAEQRGVPAIGSLGVSQSHGVLADGGNMEGKETRFGINDTMLFVAVTTSASCGAVDAMHDSLTPLGGFVPTFLMQLGEVVFGGVGSGLYGMLIFALLAVFLAGLMVGRTPEYLGKKIEIFEMKMTALAILVTPVLVLVLTSIAVLTPAGQSGVANPGAHGFSEILYAFTSAANNNGSAFAGLSVNSLFYNIATGTAMWFGRFLMIVPVLAIAGSLAGKKRLAVTTGTLPTHGALFVILLLGVVLLVGALNYVPALALGPVVEHLQMLR
ncbi:potassium-transporting ATPase subunit KdpA [Paludibacterium paludis]|uniref:Potassium-transporting ATPase potassium-binding subunit n=1 Tax=Paludibacterium paludis TaxID=1225769 RepID=A0A918NZ21_9NEIS|nr:potassium-transporting ATPase subunit KdpA [Paludibacterium paludis]GGY07717.1 potassium-transporting ATPase potassium-binding subunit [Paludibacterium paludis]